MKLKALELISFLAIMIVTVVSCSSTATTNSTYKKVDKTATNGNGSISTASSGATSITNDWRTKYKKWYRITKDKPNTGNPTGFVKNRHKGSKGYREIYINKIGQEVSTGAAPYKYPEGTIVVKEAYKNEVAWETRKKPQVTTMIKLKSGASPETGDWGYIMGMKGKLSSGESKWAKFCNKCHVYAVGKDYVFMNSDFIKSLKK